MSRISLTDFVDIVSAAGTPKANKVLLIKNRDEYQPAFDFYKKLRDHIVEIHRTGEGKTKIREILPTINDNKKLPLYNTLVSAYVSWLGRKELEWFRPPNGLYSYSNVDVSVNPELGLIINGTPYLIKLYFKKEDLAKNRIDIITHIMADRLSAQCPENTTMAVLSILQRKLFHPTVPITGLNTILNAELSYISALLT